MWRRGHVQWHHFDTKCNPTPLIGSKVIEEGGRQAGDLTSVLSFLNESRLKAQIVFGLGQTLQSLDIILILEWPKKANNSNHHSRTSAIWIMLSLSQYA
jgi:hypothetical protein